VLFGLFYLSTAISILYSDNLDEALRKLVLKLPILFFPLVCMTFKQTTFDSRIKMVGILNYAVFLPAVVSVYNYFLNKRLYDQLILESKPLPVEFGYGIYHIQFSILLASAVVFGMYSIIRMIRENQRNLWLLVIGIITCVNFIAIHILSARTGLVAMYFGIFAIVLSSLRSTSIGFKLGAAAICIILPLTLFFSSTSLQNRLKNSIIDLKVVMSGSNANEYSFAMRVEGWKNAIDIIDRNPFQGVGVGDADKELYNNFASFNPSIDLKNRRNPHNQFLETAVQSGLLSAILFLITLIAPIVLKSSHRGNSLLIALVLLMFISSNFESILERQASVVAYSTLLAFAYMFKRRDNILAGPISAPASS
jgi:O-antigen ligase